MQSHPPCAPAERVHSLSSTRLCDPRHTGWTQHLVPNACRDELLPLGVDVNPALEIHPEFVRDVPSPVSLPLV